MDIMTAIKTAEVGQKIKRKNPSTVSFVKRNMELIKISEADYTATDWVRVVPVGGRTITVGGRTYKVLRTITL